jgi:hypothetical protein
MGAISYKRHRFPPDVIRHAVWLYFRFTLSFRDVEELLAQRGISVSYETIRAWTLKFGPHIASNLKQRRPAGVQLMKVDNTVDFPNSNFAGRAGYSGTMSDAEHAKVAAESVASVDVFKTDAGPKGGHLACFGRPDE